MKKSFLKSIYPIEPWLNIHTSHLAYVRNLVITLAVAALGFSISKYSDIDYSTTCFVKCFITISIIIFGLSSFFGLLVALIQDKIFRLYRTISRDIEKADADEKGEIPESVIATNRDKTTGLETTNKCLFWFQILLFVIGTILLTVAVFKWK